MQLANVDKFLSFNLAPRTVETCLRSFLRSLNCFLSHHKNNWIYIHILYYTPTANNKNKTEEEKGDDEKKTSERESEKKKIFV